MCLIPELCYITGLTDAIRQDFRVMKVRHPLSCTNFGCTGNCTQGKTKNHQTQDLFLRGLLNSGTREEWKFTLAIKIPKRGYLTKWKVGAWGIQSQLLDRVHPNGWQILSSYCRYSSQWWICGRGHGRFGGAMPKQPLQMVHAWQSNDIVCEPTLVSLNTNQWGLLGSGQLTLFIFPLNWI